LKSRHGRDAEPEGIVSNRCGRREFLRAAGVGIAGALALGADRALGQAEREHDLVLKGGTVVDGLGAPARTADLAVSTGRIAAVGDGLNGKTEVDCAGKLVCPGFVDIHTHLDLACWPTVVDIPMPPLSGAYPEPFYRMMLEQGVTTVLAGNCGYSVSDIAAHLSSMETDKPAFNYATLVGLATLRDAATAGQDAMAGLRAALESGAFGLSVNLASGPAAEAPVEELIAPTRLLGAHEGALLAVHRRTEDRDLEKSTAEAITLGRMSGAPLQISHMRARTAPAWTQAQAAYDLVAAAAAAGLDISADMYVHPGGGMTVPMAYLPPEYWSGDYQARLKAKSRDAALLQYVAQRVADIDPTMFYPRCLGWEGMIDYDLVRLLMLRRKPAQVPNMIELIVDLAIDDNGRVPGTDVPSMGINMLEMQPDDIATAVKLPFMMIASDAGGPSSGDSRSLFPWCLTNSTRVLSLLSGEGNALTYEEAVRKMSSMPADRLGLGDRGRISVGAVADLVVVDPKKVRDTSSPTTLPRPAGIERVFVNGEQVVEAGKYNGARAGKVLRRA